MSAFSKQREASKRSEHASNFESSGRGGARIVQQYGGALLDAEAESPLFSLGPIPKCTPASDIRRPDRHFTIITTAALPWLTGTAVNPLLRALALARMNRPVVLMIPWLKQDDQRTIFPNGVTFSQQDEQEKMIRTWCKERAKTDTTKLPIQFRWYKARYVAFVRSIFPEGDCSNELGEGDPRDVLILEEPEHLCWYHHGKRWPELFDHVIGIVHTNYQDYMAGSRTDVPDAVKEISVFVSSAMVCSAYCDVNIKLSDTIMPLPNEVTCNVHGVRDEFLQIGDSELGVTTSSEPGEAASVYYLGKALYEKGWGELMDLLKAAGDQLQGVRIDGYGSGADSEGITLRGQELGENGVIFKMHPGIDHANKVIHPYGVLVNPSTSDVLCTVTVEALAMGKRCVLARHPSNRFFEENFPERCFFFRAGDTASFVEALRNAVAQGPPRALPPESRCILTWEAATERLFSSAEVRVLSGSSQRPSGAAVSRLAYGLHYTLQQDKTVLASLIREATLGEATPWDEHFSEWRKTQMDQLQKQADQFRDSLQRPPEQTQLHEKYLRDALENLERLFQPAESH